MLSTMAPTTGFPTSASPHHMCVMRAQVGKFPSSHLLCPGNDSTTLSRLTRKWLSLRYAVGRPFPNSKRPRDFVDLPHSLVPRSIPELVHSKCGQAFYLLEPQCYAQHPCNPLASGKASRPDPAPSHRAQTKPMEFAPHAPSPTKTQGPILPPPT